MRLNSAGPVLLAVCLVTGCGANDDGRDESPSFEEAQPSADYANDVWGDAAPIPPMVSPVGGVNDGEPDLTPPQLSPDAEKGEKGARNLLLSWARAIELQEFDQAWAMMGDAGQSKWTEDEFTAVFAGLQDIAVAVPDGVMEGAAGSLYYSGIATITAEDAEGRPVRIEAPVVLRRANDVPGATPEQLRWRFHSADLAVTH